MHTIHTLLCQQFRFYQRWHAHPHHQHHHWIVFAIAFLISAQAIAGLWHQTLEEIDATSNFALPRAEAAAPAGFIKRQGTTLISGSGQPMYLRGTNFTGYFSFDTACNWYTEGFDVQKYPSPDTHRPVVFTGKTGQCQNPPDEVYTDKNYKDVKNVGFNVVRFPLFYRMFEDSSAPGVYKPEGWAYLDQHIQLAKNNDIYLILDMHVPQGGFGPLGGTGSGGGGGKLLWTDTVGPTSTQTRFKNLWKAIAARYKNETIIAGYDILNEPHPIKTGATDWLGDVQAWKDLANATIADIRSVDPNHMIVVENVNWIDAHNPGGDGNWSLDVVKNFQIIVNDTNVMYDWHLYMPEEYTLFGLEPNYPGGNVVSLTGGLKKFDVNYLKEQVDIILNQGSWANYPVNVGEWASGSIFNPGVNGELAYVRDYVHTAFHATTVPSRSAHWDFYAMPQLYTGGLTGNLINARACIFKEYFGTGTCTGGGPPGGQAPLKPTLTYCGTTQASCSGGTGGDTTLPTVSLTAPAAGATVSGTVTVSATASDNVGVTKVEFKDGASLIGTDTTSPYSVSWNTTSTANGAHSLTAVAFDAAGNQKTSTAVSVTVSNSTGGGGGCTRFVVSTDNVNSAISQLRSGETLCLRDGTYNQPLTVAVSGTASQRVIVKAENPGRVTVNATGADQAVKITGDYATIKDLTVTGAVSNPSRPNTLFFGIMTTADADYAVFENVISRDNQWGIGLFSKGDKSSGKGHVITNCQVFNIECLILSEVELYSMPMT